MSLSSSHKNGGQIAYFFFLFDSIFVIMIVLFSNECLAQLGEHFLDVEGVMGSSPVALTKRSVYSGPFLFFNDI